MIIIENPEELKYSNYCILEDGTISPYNFAHKSKNPNPEYVKNMEYIGKGVICAANFVPQNFNFDNPEHIIYFWK